MLLVELPTQLRYHQPRGEHRVEVLNMGLPVVLTADGGESHEGVLADLSATGVSVHLSATAAFGPGMSCRCSIRHGKGLELQVELEICSVLPEGTDGGVRLGARLREMPRHAQIQWERLVFELERRMLRPQAPLPSSSP